MIVVLGAGLIGLGIACELARRGEPVRVLETGETGRGASWAGAGMLAPGTEGVASGPFADLCRDSLRRYPEFVARLRDEGGIDARLRLDGILDVAFDEPGERRLAARVRDERAAGADVEALDARRAREVEPELAPGARAAVLARGEGAVDNRRLGRALDAAARALGVRIETGVGSVVLEADGRRALGVRTDLGFVGADAVVNALGAWAGALAGVPPEAAVPVVPVKGQMLAIAAPLGGLARTTWVPGAYLVPRDDGRLLVGATVEPAAGFDRRVTAGAIRALLDAALAAVPGLAERSVAETWAGLRPGTPDGEPYLGATTLANYVVAAGHYRNGILLTPATAVGIADLLLGVPRPDLATFSPARAHAPAAANVSA